MALPIDDVLPELVDALRGSSAAVLQAPPGAGKTTRVPLALLDVVPRGQMWCSSRGAWRRGRRRGSSRRTRGPGSASSSATRCASRTSRRRARAILVVTEGILSRRFLRDATLDGISCVVLDEFHERSVHTNLALAFTRELLEVRDDLKLVVMSATLDAAAVAEYLGAGESPCPVITSAGRPFPVDVRHVDKRDERPLDERVAGAVRTMLKDTATDGGDVLAFLPGAPEIRRVHERLAQDGGPAAGFDVVDLYGALPPAEQDRALAPSAGRRRVILATNVAETSVTIDGVTGVVDSGLMKRAAHDPVTDRERLETVRISVASADQRAGRAGRTRPGKCLRLWTQTEHTTLEASHAPEIARVDLARVLLDVLAFHPGDPRAFPFFEAPSTARIERALDLLRMLGAVEGPRATAGPAPAPGAREAGVDVRLTERGRALAALPLHPRTGSMLLAGAFDVEEVCRAAAVLEDDRAWPREQARHSTDSDLLALLDDLPRHARGDVERGARDLARFARAGTRTLTEALLAGYPDRLCRRRRPGQPEALMTGGRGVTLARESGVDADVFLALALEGTGAAARVRVAHAVKLSELDVIVRDEAVFDEDKLIGVRRTYAGDLVVDEKRGIAVSAAAAAAALAEHVARDVERYVKLDDARLRFARRAMPEEPWPDVDVGALVAEACAGKRTLAEVQAVDFGALLLSKLPWAQRKLLDEQAPPRLEVPTGNMISVDYGGAEPVLAVRLQELFGLTETPRIAKGRVPVVLHLLSPGHKPVQVTTDLASFWRTTYADVKKELRARYPKHAWPDDPLTAPPTARARRRR